MLPSPVAQAYNGLWAKWRAGSCSEGRIIPSMRGISLCLSRTVNVMSMGICSFLGTFSCITSSRSSISGRT
uniref:Uncharacterized protein n=1 Tax=Mycena chlorophos TaxID=658473 RepID=A0ABQ0LWE1_MYCCL|nr:predicted protein [Mycena chlorophos]